MNIIKMIKKTEKVFNTLNLKDGEGIDLGNDVFLTGMCDGSDKIYGFGLLDGEYYVSGSSGPYRIGCLEYDDFTYIVSCVLPHIGRYSITKFDDI